MYKDYFFSLYLSHGELQKYLLATSTLSTVDSACMDM